MFAQNMIHELLELFGNVPRALVDNTGEELEYVLHLNLFIHISVMNHIAET